MKFDTLIFLDPVSMLLFFRFYLRKKLFEYYFLKDQKFENLTGEGRSVYEELHHASSKWTSVFIYVFEY